MGLYLNNHYPDIYRREETLDDTNQVIYFHSREEEKRKEQEQLQETVQHYLHDLKGLFEAEQLAKSEKWKELDAKYEKIMHKLDGITKENEQLAETVERQTAVQEVLQDDLKRQMERTEYVVERIDEQDAFIDKIIRQLEFLRSSLFERTSFLAEKIEEARHSIFRFLKSKEAKQLHETNPEKEKVGQ